MRRFFAIVLFVALAAPALGQERTHDITPGDYASVNTITEVALSPDGKQVAYCLATWDKKADNRRTESGKQSDDRCGLRRSELLAQALKVATGQVAGFVGKYPDNLIWRLGVE